MRWSLAVAVALVAAQVSAADKQLVVVAKGETLAGTCVSVHDGDTIKLLVDTQIRECAAEVREHWTIERWLGLNERDDRR